MGVFEVFATGNSLVGNCYLESEKGRKDDREGPQVWYPAHRNTAHLGTYPYKLYSTSRYIPIQTMIHNVYLSIKYIL